jgi:ATP-dependent 26S proteasome regulatory subunit
MNTETEIPDRTLVERYVQLKDRYASLEQDLEHLRGNVDKLRKVLGELMAPPWYPSVFLRLASTALGPLAEVTHEGNRRLVHLGPDVNPDELATGQTVYLGHERNAILGVAPADLPEAGEIASVERLLDDGRLALRDRDEQVLVHTARAVRDSQPKAGDSVRWSRPLMLALEAVQNGAPSELFVEEYLSAEHAQRLGGLTAETAQVVSTFTQGIAKPEMARRYGLSQNTTLLLHGPPGNGKTSMARVAGSALAAATGQQCRFASIKGAQLESPWVGTTQRNVRELFRELGRDPRPTLLFIDEVEAIGRHRGATAGHHSDKFLSAWLTEIDGLERRGSFGIIATTNRKDLLDQALLERLSGMELYIGRPSLEAAREIFEIHLPPTLPYGPNGAQAEQTRTDMVEAAVATLYGPNADNAIARLRLRDGRERTVVARQILSGRTIEQICLQARRNAFRRQAEGGPAGVRVEDLEQAVADALDRLATTLSVANARVMLGDLPQDLEVVAVETVRHRVTARHHRVRSALG